MLKARRTESGGLRPFALWLVPVVVLSLLAGCTTPGDGPDAAVAPSTQQPPRGSFAPSFELLAPEVRVEGIEPHVAGQQLTFRAVFPLSVDVSKVREALWDFGDGTFGVGLSAQHTFEEGGLHRVSLSVRDDYDRQARTERLVPVAQVHVFTGTVGVGSGGADARPESGDGTHDHVDHRVALPASALDAIATLSYSPDTLTCVQPDVCVPGEAALIARILDAQGQPIAESGPGAPPRSVEAGVAGLTEAVVRVSGDKGVNVSYELTIMVLFGEA